MIIKEWMERDLNHAVNVKLAIGKRNTNPDSKSKAKSKKEINCEIGEAKTQNLCNSRIVSSA